MARSRSFTVSADGANNQTPFISLREGGLVTLEGTFVGTVTLQRKGSDGNIVDATGNTGTIVTYTAKGTYTIDCGQTQGLYRLNCKSGAFTSGPLIMMIEGR